MAAELRLGVSFDLVYFRQQLQKLNQIAASEFSAKVKIGIDKRDFQRQFNALSKDLKINVNDSQLIAARDRLTNLNKGLATFRRASAQPIVIKFKYEQQGQAPAGLSTGGGSFRQRLTSLGQQDKAALQQLYKAAGRASLLAFDAGIENNKARMVKALGDVGEDSIQGLLNGLKSKDSDLKSAAKGLGNDLIRSIKDVLGIASPSREFKKIGEDSGEGLEQGLKSGIGEAARMGVQEIRSLFRALQGEAQSGAVRLQATMMAAMSGLVQLPGGRQQRGRLMQTGAGINAAMTGPALPNVQARRGAARGAAATAPAFAAALPLMFGMDPRELTARLQGLYGQQYRAPDMGGRQAPRPGRIASLIASLASSGGGFGAGTGVNQRLFTGGAVNPGVLPSGYIGRSALSAQYVNYPPGMPVAYGSGFAGGTSGSYGMARARMQGPALPVRGVFSTASGSLGQFPSAGMMGPASPRGSMGMFPMAGMAYPSSPLGVITAQSSMFGGGGSAGGGGGGGGGRFGGAGAFFGGQLPSNLPGQGLVKEMGSEFGFAAKQVLLFGTTYKALAAITGFPAQVTEAVSALQNFRNTLGAITPSAAEFRDSNDLILGLVDKYNIPLQSARDGFTRLYASMEPAGFNGEEIRALFTGISKAAATFGMSADKVDRVNYAFAQMASKGQVMSEELKGQLGDVLPGAMSIFAEAAGFKGKDAITEFSQALEDGAYKGDAMKVLLTNVSAIMNKEFGPGAEGAARTFQGAMNRMQNSMKLLYETFEPVAVQFLNSVVTPFSDGIKTLTDGLNSFFTGAAAKTSGGFAIATELNKLRPTFEGIKKNASEVAKQLLDLAKVALELGKVFLQIAGNPINGYIARLYLIFLPLNTALNIAKGLWAANAIQLAIFNARIATGTSTLTAFRGMMAATGATAKTTGTAIRAAGITLKTFFASTGVGLILVGLSLLIEKFMSMNQALADTRAKAIGAAQAIRAMSQTEALQEGRKAEAGVRLIQKLKDRGPAYEGSKHVSMSAQEGQQLRDLGIPAERTISGGFRLPIDMLDAHRQRLETVNIAESRARVNQLRFEEQQSRLPTPLAEIPGGGGDGEGKKERRIPLDQLLDLESQRAQKMAASDRELRLAQLIRDAKIAGNESEAESLENISKALGIKGKIAALEEFRNMLIEREDEIIGKSLTKEQFNNKLQDANVELHALQNDLQKEYLELQTRESDNEKKRQQKLKEEAEKRAQILRLIEDAQIASGRIGPVEAARIQQRRGFQGDIARAQEDAPDLVPQLMAAQAAIPAAGSVAELAKNAREEFEQLTNGTNVLKEAAYGIGDAFAQSFSSILTGAVSVKQGISDLFKNIGKMFIDMAVKMIAQYMVMKAIGLIASFFGGGTSSSGGSSQGLQWNPATMDFDPVGSANGNVLLGGFKAFANGGTVTGPTLGLIGEGRFNEAVVPLPDGRSIPVELGQGAGNNIATNITVNVSNGQAQSTMSGRGGTSLGRELDAAVKDVILRETRPGGIIYSSR